MALWATCFNFLNIVQYLFVHCTIPSILGSHLPYPTSPPTPNIAFTSTLTHQPDPPPPPTHPLSPPPPKNIFFRIFTKTSILHSHPPCLPQPEHRPGPDPTPHIFFEFSQKLHFSVTSTLTPPPTRPHPRPDPHPSPPPKKKKFYKNFNCSFTSTLTSPNPNTLAPSFLNRLSSFLQVTRTCMKAWMSSNFGQIPPPTPELSALARLKN